jgi:hypothetical protein
MKTHITSVIKLIGSSLVSLSCTFGLQAQSNPVTPSRTSSADRLLAESESMFLQAEQLRNTSEYRTMEAKREMLEEASAMEKMAEKKRCQGLKQSFLDKMVLVKNNLVKIDQLNRNTLSEKNSERAYDLLTEIQKNKRMAEQLYEEALSETKIPMQLGNLDNATEKIQLVLRQQAELLQVLKVEETKALSRK